MMGRLHGTHVVGGNSRPAPFYSITEHFPCWSEINPQGTMYYDSKIRVCLPGQCVSIGFVLFCFVLRVAMSGFRALARLLMVVSHEIDRLSESGRRLLGSLTDCDLANPAHRATVGRIGMDIDPSTEWLRCLSGARESETETETEFVSWQLLLPNTNLNLRVSASPDISFAGVSPPPPPPSADMGTR